MLFWSRSCRKDAIKLCACAEKIHKNVARTQELQLSGETRFFGAKQAEWSHFIEVYEITSGRNKMKA